MEKNHQSDDGFVQLLVLLFLVAILALVLSSSIYTHKNSSSKVLGDEISTNSDHHGNQTLSSPPMEKPRPTGLTDTNGNAPLPNASASALPGEENLTSGVKSEFLLNIPDGQKIQAKVDNNGSTHLTVEQGDLKIKYINHNGKIEIKTENNQGQNINLNPSQLDTITSGVEDSLKADGITISTNSGVPEIIQNRIAAVSSFPLSVDVNTHQLTVTTPNGQKTVTVLPDQAINNLLSNKTISQLISTNSGTLVSGRVQLQESGNQLVYKVNGIKTYKVLGIIPISTPVSADVSVSSGTTVSTNQPLIASLLKLISTN